MRCPSLRIKKRKRQSIAVRASGQGEQVYAGEIVLMKKSALVHVLVLGIFLCYSQAGYCSEQTPEQIVRDFYAWYLSQDGNDGEKIPERRAEIYNFVSKQTVDAVLSQINCKTLSYFTKLGVFGGIARVDVGTAVPAGAKLFVVPITFIHTNNDRVGALVVLHEEAGKLRITKVIDKYPFF